MVNLIVYCGTKYGKAKKRIVEKEARGAGYKATAPFIWAALRGQVHLSAEGLAELDAIEAKETTKRAHGI